MIRTALLALGVACSAAASPELEVQPGTLRPGDALLVTIRDGGMPLRGVVGKSKLRFFGWDGDARALLALPLTTPLGPVDVRVDLAAPKDGGVRLPWPPPDAGEDTVDALDELEEEEADGGALDAGRAPHDAGVHPMPDYWVPSLQATIEIVDPHFPRRELKVAKQYIEPSAAAKKQMADDAEAVKNAYHQPFGHPLFHENFAWPRATEITSHFGDLRLYNGKKQSQHYGTDLEGRTGDPILAANDGTVVLARACYASGNTVLVYHGVGLFTAYFHMTVMEVKAGDKVKRSQRIGQVGKTGRVTGPHLHFGVKLQGNYVNPESLLELDFE